MNVTDYDEQERSVRFTEKQYQYIFKSGSAPVSIWSVRFERLPNSESSVYFFGKYVTMADYARVLKKEIVSVIDANSPGKVAATETEYLYESTSHRFVTTVSSKTPDGTIYSSKFKYPHDFGVIPQNSTNELLRIRDLQDPEVFRHSIPIETRKTVKLPGGSEKVTGASLALFSDFGSAGKILPHQSLSLQLSAPLTDFDEAKMVNDGGTYKLGRDDRYVITSTVEGYTSFDRPTSMHGRDRRSSSSIWGYNSTAPIATVADASAQQIAFSDFETTSQNSFEVIDGYQSMPRTGNYGIHPYGTLRKTIVKGKASTFSLSFWARSATGFTLIVRVKNEALSTTLHSLTINVPASSEKFVNLKELIQVGSFPTKFVIEIQGQSLPEPSASSSSLLPSVDDISFVPSDADLASATYFFPYGVTSTTDAFNKTMFSEYDLFGRQTITRDKDKNVRSKISYQNALDRTLDPIASFETGLEVMLLGGDSFASEVAYVGEPITCTANPNSCFSDMEYEWTYGLLKDFSTQEYSTGSTTFVAQFDQPGGFGIALRVRRAGGTWIKYGRPINVIYRPITVSLCSNGARTYQCGQVSYRSNNCNGDPVSLEPGTQLTATVEESLPDLTYTWYRRYFDTETWTELFSSSNSSYTLAALYGNPNNQRGFEVKCVVTNGFRKGETNKIRIDVEPCDQ